MKKIYLTLLIYSCQVLCNGQNWEQQGMDFNGQTANDVLGTSLDLSDDGLTIAIGVAGNNMGTGLVQLYTFDGNSWIQKGSDINGKAIGDASGRSVSLSSDGSTVAIGAPRNSSDSGHVRVFNYNGSDWVQQGDDIDGEASGDLSGISLSLSDDGLTVVIGAPSNEGNGLLAGHVRVYNFNGINWIQKGNDIDGENSSQFGSSTSISSDGSIIIIGSPNSGANVGSVRAYEFDGNDWIQKGSSIDGEDSNDESGTSISLSSDGLTIGIGAPFNDKGGVKADIGRVKVYKFDGNDWVQKGSNIDGEDSNDESGTSISLSADGSTIAIGAPKNSSLEKGHTRVYTFDGTDWLQKGFDIDGNLNDEFGSSVKLSSDGTTVSMASTRNDENGSNSGQVKVFKFSPAPEDSTISTTNIKSNINTNINIYPNPSKELLHIEFIKKSIGKVELLTTTGQVIISKRINNQKALLFNVKNLEVGVYFLRIKTNDNQLLEKIFIN